MSKKVKIGRYTYLDLVKEIKIDLISGTIKDYLTHEFLTHLKSKLSHGAHLAKLFDKQLADKMSTSKRVL